MIEIEKKLNELEVKEFYRWLIINMPRLKVNAKVSREKRADESTSLHTHPRHNQSKY
jgi:hypothetical protein